MASLKYYKPEKEKVQKLNKVKKFKLHGIRPEQKERGIDVPNANASR